MNRFWASKRRSFLEVVRWCDIQKAEWHGDMLFSLVHAWWWRVELADFYRKKCCCCICVDILSYRTSLECMACRECRRKAPESSIQHKARKQQMEWYTQLQTVCAVKRSKYKLPFHKVSQYLPRRFLRGYYSQLNLCSLKLSMPAPPQKSTFSELRSGKPAQKPQPRNGWKGSPLFEKLRKFGATVLERRQIAQLPPLGTLKAEVWR